MRPEDCDLASGNEPLDSVNVAIEATCADCGTALKVDAWHGTLDGDNHHYVASVIPCPKCSKAKP